MADNKHTNFEELIKGFAGEDGNILAASIGPLTTAVRNAVGNEFVAKSRYNAKLEEIRQLNEAAQTAEDNAATAPDWKKKYEDEHTAFERYKGEIAAKETLAAKKAAYMELLKDSGISAAYHEKVAKYADFNAMELDDRGKLKSPATLMKAAREEWPMWVETVTEEGADTPKPQGTGAAKTMTREEILAIKDTDARQKAIGENLDLFGGA